MAKLKILTGPMRDRVFELDKDKKLILGRSPNQAGITVPDSAVSRRHAEFSCANGLWSVRDLDSSNGTFLNEVRVNDPEPLYAADQVRCGSTVMLFEADETELDLLRPREQAQGLVELKFDPGETMVAVAFESFQSKQTARHRQRMLHAGQAALHLSHGIKNILQAVRSGQDVMDDAFTQRDLEQARKAWQILKRNLDKIQKLVLDMLKFSRQEPPHLQACQFNRLAESVINLLRPQAQQKQAVLALQIDEELRSVSIDPDQMQDVIMNLVLNAIEAVGSGGEITVYTEMDRQRRQAVLRVSDNGKGIEDTRIIFEPFHTDKPNVGTGLGLTIARKIVQMHKGAIDVQSVPGQGSIFTVRLPL
ncbi:MAG: FHA domain-containing protein [Planctomycetaceae bacterium]|nr:FHA domain-containing protein [Planctomycetaceae bacterium]